MTTINVNTNTINNVNTITNTINNVWNNNVQNIQGRREDRHEEFGV